MYYNTIKQTIQFIKIKIEFNRILSNNISYFDPLLDVDVIQLAIQLLKEFEINNCSKLQSIYLK